MSVILLDTHVVPWLGASERLGLRAAQRIAEAQANGRISIPAISFWEEAMLVDEGRMCVGGSVRDFVGVIALPSILMVVDANIATDAGSLPSPIHGDPCDRLIITTARVLDRPLLTADDKILAYAAGHLRAVDARR